MSEPRAHLWIITGAQLRPVGAVLQGMALTWKAIGTLSLELCNIAALTSFPGFQEKRQELKEKPLQESKKKTQRHAEICMERWQTKQAQETIDSHVSYVPATVGEVLVHEA